MVEEVMGVKPVLPSWQAEMELKNRQEA